MSEITDILDEFDTGVPVAESVWRRRNQTRSQQTRARWPVWKRQLVDARKSATKKRNAAKNRGTI